MSVGDGTHTRQITHVAAGFADTDAVNVVQLKAVEEGAGLYDIIYWQMIFNIISPQAKERGFTYMAYLELLPLIEAGDS